MTNPAGAGGNTFRLSAWVTLTLLLAVFASNVYRAATQGITVDEAYTYKNFVAPRLSQVMRSFDGNHHVLNSLLAKLATSLFGVSELTLRIPSLMGGLIYLVAARAVVLYVLSTEWAIAAFALLGLNPFVMDYLSAARGYGLALGFLMSALWFLLQGGWYRAGICLGLTLASNLTFLFPVAAVGGVTAVVEAREKHLGEFLTRAILPAMGVAVAAWALPLTRARRDQFYFSAPDIATSVDSFLVLSLNRVQPFLYELFPWVATLGILVLVTNAAAFVVLLRKKCWTPLERLILLNGGAMAACFAIIWLAHVTLSVGYPFTRTGVYWPVMLSLGGVSLTERFVRWHALRWTALLFAVLFVAQFLREFDVRYYGEWKFDSGSKRIAQILLRSIGLGDARIAADENLSHSLVFYRDRYGAKWDIILDPKAQASVHVLLAEQYRSDLKLLYRDPVSSALIMQ